MERDMQPRYVISIAAEMLGTQTYTLRYYEKIGIVNPARSKGNIRLYSDLDLEVIKRVMTLMDELGVNLAGVEVILRMSQQIAQLQKNTEELEKEIARLRKERNETG
ncbi:MAG TPA: MerR family DNA-binding transcriptional regulator [Dehalococcoidia bacterium]|nr:MerR family DNA-binding transcriptional regulator [Dehalococcoidia bacterium]HAS27597.1 MerR family DNA-binding transcriptional regulator [Dehalococcoidia bacterium]